MVEELYTPAEVAAILKISVKSVIRKFENQSGVINLGSRRKPTTKKRKKVEGEPVPRERYFILRIPKSVLGAMLAESRVQ